MNGEEGASLGDPGGETGEYETRSDSEEDCKEAGEYGAKAEDSGECSCCIGFLRVANGGIYTRSEMRERSGTRSLPWTLPRSDKICRGAIRCSEIM